MGRRIKVVVVGDEKTGKTSLVHSFVHQEPIGRLTQIDPVEIEMNIDNEEYTLEICDTTGRGDFERLRILHYPNTHVFLICFSCENKGSHSSIPTCWIPELNHHCPNSRYYFLCTKVDLRTNQREEDRGTHSSGGGFLTKEDGELLANKFHACKYFETSALTGFGNRELLEELCRFNKYAIPYLLLHQIGSKKKCLIA